MDAWSYRFGQTGNHILTLPRSLLKASVAQRWDSHHLKSFPAHLWFLHFQECLSEPGGDPQTPVSAGSREHLVRSLPTAHRRVILQIPTDLSSSGPG